MRIVSLLPAATEIVAAIGGSDDLVAISHECDHPAEILGRRRITASPIDGSATSAEIDAAVRRAVEDGRPVIGVDATALREARPDVVLTQSLCDVCAVDGSAARGVAAVCDPPPRVVSLGATTLDGMYADCLTVGRAIGREAAAGTLVARLRRKMDELRARPAPAGRTPRVVCVEWTDPLYLAGHWVPELVEAAGGEDVGAAVGAPSRRRSWAEVEALRPDVLLVMLCGFGADRSRRELGEVDDPVGRRLLGAVPTAIIDGNAFTSRAGPRLVEGAEHIREAIEGLNVPV